MDVFGYMQNIRGEGGEEIGPSAIENNVESVRIYVYIYMFTRKSRMEINSPE